jgi:hypothetical protein
MVVGEYVPLACLLDCIFGSSGVPQIFAEPCDAGWQIGQSGHLKFSIAIQNDRAGIDVSSRVLGIDGAIGWSHVA